MSENIQIIEPAPLPSGSDPIVITLKKFPLFSVLLLLILSVVSIICVYLFLQVRELSMSQPVPLLIPSPPPTIDPIVVWESYVHDDQSFRIDYPSNFVMSEIDDYENSINLKSQTVLTISPIDSASYQSFRSLGLTIHNNTNISEIRSASMKNYMLGENPALRDEYSWQRGNQYGPRFYDLRTIFQKNKLIYDFYAEFSYPPNSKELELADQIISSIIFYDTSVSYSCPASGYVDCIPSQDGQKPSCTKEAMDWYKANCPDFKGAAL